MDLNCVLNRRPRCLLCLHPDIQNVRQITIESHRTIHHDLNQSAVTRSRNDDVIKAAVTNAGVEREGW